MSDSVLDDYETGSTLEESSVPPSRFSEGVGAKTSRSRSAAHFRRANSLKLSKLRTALVQATTVDDIISIWATLITDAEGGNLKAIQIVFDRLFGPPINDDIVARLEQLEEKHARESLEGSVPLTGNIHDPSNNGAASKRSLENDPNGKDRETFD